MMKKIPFFQRTFAATLACSGLAAAAAVQPARLLDIADLSLEQLAQVSVTSTTRRPERLAAAPASIYVITREDIRRSGVTSLAEALRLAPNLHVARTDAMQYAITARGGNTNTANKMLVMVDGRTVYSPLFSGVFWDAQDVALEDVERIEVVSGPAATLWGTNGVNGVINITTLAAEHTQGILASGGAGTGERGATLRYGGRTPGGAGYRAYARYYERDSHERDPDGAMLEGGERAQAGFRMDWKTNFQDVTVQGDVYKGEHGNPGGPRDVSGINLLGLWNGRDEGGDYRFQAYYDRTEREHAGTFRETRDTVDLDYSRRSALGTDHQLVWGAGYRASRDFIGNSAALAFLPDRRTLRWANAFVQDEITLGPQLKATLGLRVEHNTYTDIDWLPNARLAWLASPDELVWIAVSRAARAPSRIDRELFLPGTAPYTVLAGGAGFESEIAKVVELGYRAQVSPKLSLSLTAFHHDFDKLRSIELADGLRVLANGLEGRNRGLEGWGTWRPHPSVRFSGGFVAMEGKFQAAPGRIDLGGLPALGNDPKRFASVRMQWDVSEAWQLDLGLRHVGRLPNPEIPAYTVVGARLGWRVSKQLDFSLRVENLADKRFAEFGPRGSRALFERTWLLRMTWAG